jgi:predicted Zn-dependent protease
VAEVLSSDLAGKQALARGKLRLAAFSRNQELQADVIGVRMLGEAGYDPYAAARFLVSMDSFASFGGAQGDSSYQGLDFLSSHPSAPRRVELARRHARQFGQQGKFGDRGRDYYLEGIDGLLYGDSPQEGYVRGQSFLHGKLGIRFDVPSGFEIDNTAEAVLATGPGEAAIRFDGVSDPTKRPLTKYIASGWVAGLLPDTIQSTLVNGLEAATARATADRWNFDITVIRVEKQIYRFLTAVPRGNPDLEKIAGELRSSFVKMNARDAASLKPLRIRVITARSGDTLKGLAARIKGTERKAELFRLLNALGPRDKVTAGQKYKIVSE